MSISSVWGPPQSGKTTLSIDLSHAFSQHGKSVCLISPEPYSELTARMGIRIPRAKSLRQIEAQLADAEHQYSDMIQSSENLRSEYDQLLTWADLYKKSSFEAKKMIVSQFIKAVYVGRDYDIDIEFNVSFDDFRHFSSNIEEIRDAPMRFASA